MGKPSGKEQDYTAMGMRRAIVLLSIPTILEMGMEALFALVDTYFVSKLGGGHRDRWFDRIADGTGVFHGLGLGMGITAVVARRTGAKDRPGTRIAAGQSLFLAIVLGLVLAIPAALFAPRLLVMMGAGADVLAVATPYARLMLASNLVVTLLFAINAVFRGAGDPGIALRTLAIANGINIVLDPALIFGLGPFPALGLYGAAVATTIGRSIGVLFLLWNLIRPGGNFGITRAHVRPVAKVLRGIIKVSLGGVGQFLIASLSWVFLVRIIAMFGTVAVGGYMVAVRIVIVAMLPAWGMANAAATLVGQNLGAEQLDRAARSAWWCGHYNMVYMVLVTVLVLVGSAASFRSSTMDPRPMGMPFSRCGRISLGYFFYGYGMVLAQALNGAGDSLDTDLA
ncbi:MAG: MATE family efflux transporter [Flavobacteriales bacterium]|nr:MATE family efflux transporter [Flavobacteriales bacterium]